MYNCVGPAAAQRQGRHSAQPALRRSKSRLGADVDWTGIRLHKTGLAWALGAGLLGTSFATTMCLFLSVSVCACCNVLVISCPPFRRGPTRDLSDESSPEFQCQTLNLTTNQFLPMESSLHRRIWRLDENAGCETTRSVAASCLISICRQTSSQSSRVPGEGARTSRPALVRFKRPLFWGDVLVSLLVPDALFIATANCRITSRLRPPTPFPLRWTDNPFL